MLTSKERANLRALATSMDAIFQIGKGNLTEAVIAGINDALEKRELIKITVLNTSDFSSEEILTKLAKSLRAEQVTAIGNKVVLYRKSKIKDFKHLEF